MNGIPGRWTHKRNLLLPIALLVPGGGCAAYLAYWAGQTERAAIQLAVNPSEEQPCVAVPNGCGPLGALGLIVPECPVVGACFTSACNEHDLCYTTCGVTQAECDEQFFHALNTICAENFAEGDPRREPCFALAYVYWQAVARLGEEFFIDAQVSACACAAEDVLLDAAGHPRKLRAPFEDRDDDLLPDDWEIEFGCDPDDPTDAMLDFDGDGLLNLEEFINRTDPFVAVAPRLYDPSQQGR